MYRLLCITTFCLFLASCGAPSVDTSSDEAFKASIKAMEKELSEEDNKRFKKALVRITLEHMDLKLLIKAGADAKEEAERQLKIALDGKTAMQIIEEAENL
ncbi:DUF6694 family lipoprotein [Aliikangiella sp. IMCC44653]